MSIVLLCAFQSSNVYPHHLPLPEKSVWVRVCRGLSLPCRTGVLGHALQVLEVRVPLLGTPGDKRCATSVNAAPEPGSMLWLLLLSDLRSKGCWW